MLVPVIVGFAGNRVDADDRDGRPRFPASQTDAMRRRLTRLVSALEPRLVVGAAAAGADLLVLETAMACGVAIDVVLPSGVTEFPERSVADRGSPWTEAFDRVVTEASTRDRAWLIEHREPADQAGYQAGNRHLLDEAVRQADPHEAVIALAIRPPTTAAARASPTTSSPRRTPGSCSSWISIRACQPATRRKSSCGPGRNTTGSSSRSSKTLTSGGRDATATDHRGRGDRPPRIGGGMLELPDSARPADEHEVVVEINRLSSAVARATPSLAVRLASATDGGQV